MIQALVALGIVLEIVLGVYFYYSFNEQRQEAEGRVREAGKQVRVLGEFKRDLAAYPAVWDPDASLEMKYARFNAEMDDLFAAYQIDGRMAVESGDPKKPLSAAFKPTDLGSDVKSISLKIVIAKYKGWSYLLGVLDAMMGRYPVALKMIEINDGRVSLNLVLYGRAGN